MEDVIQDTPGVVRKKPNWRKAKRVLDLIRDGKLIAAACEEAGISIVTFYRWRKKSKLFNEIYNDHLYSKVALLEEKLLELALGGDRALLMFALKNLDKLKYGEEMDLALKEKANNIINVQLIENNVTNIQDNKERPSNEGNIIEGQARALLTEQS